MPYIFMELWVVAVISAAILTTTMVRHLFLWTCSPGKCLLPGCTDYQARGRLDLLEWTIKLVVNAVIFNGCLLSAFVYTEASPKLMSSP